MFPKLRARYATRFLWRRNGSKIRTSLRTRAPLLRLLSPLVRLLLEDAAIIRPPHILHPQHAILGPHQRIRHGPLKRKPDPPEQVPRIPQSPPRIEEITFIQAALATLVVIFDKLLKHLWPEAALIVVRHGIRAVLRAVDARHEEAEEGVGQVGRGGGVRESDVDDERAEEGEEEGPAPGAEADEGVLRPDHAVIVAVPVGYVLLERLGDGAQGLASVSCRVDVGKGPTSAYCLMQVLFGPAALCCAMWGGTGGYDIRACDAGIVVGFAVLRIVGEVGCGITVDVTCQVSVIPCEQKAVELPVLEGGILIR